MGRGQVPHQRFQFAHGLRAEDFLDPLRVLVRGEAALGVGVAQHVRDPVAVRVGRTEVGVLPKVGLGVLLKVHGSSVPKRDRSRLEGVDDGCGRVWMTY